MGSAKTPSHKLGRRQRTPLEKARDSAEAKKLRLRYRKTAAEIALILDAQYRDLPEIDEITGKFQPTIGVKMVEYILSKSLEEFKKDETDEIHAARLDLIRRYEDLALLCQERFDASLVDKVTLTEQEGDKAGERSSLSKKVSVNTEGASDYLRIKEVCLWKIAELRQVIPPKKIAPTNPEGTEAYRFDTNEIEMKRLRAFAMELQIVDAETKELISINGGRVLR